MFRGGFGIYTVDVKFPTGRGQYDEYVAMANQQAAPGDPTPIYQISQGTGPGHFNVRPEWHVPVRGHQLRLAQRGMVGSESA